MENIRTPYRHRGFPLTPRIAAELIKELFSGETIQRSKVIPTVITTHRDRGGEEGNANDTAALFKKALSILRKEGFASDSGTGARYCRISDATAEAMADVLDGGVENETDDEEAFGGAVYAFYLPVYRKMAELQNETEWPIKVGMSALDAPGRISAQKSGLPEKPVTALVIETDTPSALEKAIHGALTVRGKHKKNTGGSEWFQTSVDEIISVVKFIDPSLQCTIASESQFQQGRTESSSLVVVDDSAPL